MQGAVFQPARTHATLRILATSDLHMRLLPTDSVADTAIDRAAGGPSLAGVAALLRRLRPEVPASVLLDCGDFLQGTPMADYLGLDRGLRPGEPHPMIAAMNALGVDAATLGNHEFTYGLDFLRAALAGARFAVVCGNLAPTDARALAAPHALIERTLRSADGQAHRLRLGVLGLSLPQVVEWEHTVLQGRLTAQDPLEAARRLLPGLRAAGADLVVALAHTGIAADGRRSAAESAGLALAALPGVDALVLGHSHVVFPGAGAPAVPGVDPCTGTLHGKPAVLPGRWGSHLGVMDLALEPRPAGGWRIVGHRVRALEVPPLPPDPPDATPCVVRAAAQPLQAATRAHLRQPVGHSPVALHSHFARIAECRALRLVAAAQRTWAQSRLQGRPEADWPLLSITAPFKCGGLGGPGHFTDIPAGLLRLGHVHDLYDFPNTLQLIRLTGAQVIDWLERVAGCFAQVAPGARDVDLLLPDSAGYHFDLIDGLDYVVDVARPARFGPDGRLRRSGARRVRARWPDGRRLDPAEHMVAVLNSYRAGGGGGFPGTGPCRGLTTPDSPVRDAILAHLRSPAPQEPSGHWRLQLPPGASVRVQTGPGAAAHLAELAAFRPEWCGPVAGGFAVLRLHGPEPPGAGAAKARDLWQGPEQLA